jgi:hypothetical protein
MFQGKEKREEILKSTRNKTGNLKSNNLQTQPTIPSQLVTKFISMEGIELNQKDTLTNEITLPTEITASDLNKLMNEQLLKNEEEKQSW